MNTQKCTGRKLFYVIYRVDRYDCCCFTEDHVQSFFFWKKDRI